MMKQLLDSGAADDIVRLPPALKLGAALPKSIQKLAEQRIACPEIIGRSEQSEHASRLVGPRIAEETLHCGSGKHVEQDVTVFLRNAPEVRDELCGCVVPDEKVPPAASDVGRVLQVLDHTADRLWDNLTREGGAIGMFGERPKMGMFHLAKPQSFGQRINRGCGWADGAPLLQPDVPIHSDASAFRDLLTP